MLKNCKNYFEFVYPELKNKIKNLNTCISANAVKYGHTFIREHIAKFSELDYLERVIQGGSCYR